MISGGLLRSYLATHQTSQTSFTASLYISRARAVVSTRNLSQPASVTVTSDILGRVSASNSQIFQSLLAISVSLIQRHGHNGLPSGPSPLLQSRPPS